MASSNPRDQFPDLAGTSTDPLLPISEHFAHLAKVDTIEQIISAQANRLTEARKTASRFQSTAREDTSRNPEDKQDLTDLDAKTGFKPTSASDLLSAFSNVTLLYERRSIPSVYIPSSKMMFYIIHQMNSQLCDSSAFLRICPNYHPYIFRLYCGVLFWIQCLRAQSHAGKSTGKQLAFLRTFLDQFPIESLPVPGPLLMLFKTICASKPELEHYGFLTPVIPGSCGPSQRSTFIGAELSAHFLPNVPGIFALLEDLSTRIFMHHEFPNKGEHCPVTEEVAIFGYHNFPAHAARTRSEKWSLVSPGLDYPCEADSQLHRNFARHYLNFGFPLHTATDNLRNVDKFLSLHRDLQWFNNIRNVVSCISEFFKNSRTLSECPPFGFNANQYLVSYATARPVLRVPRKIADPNSAFPLAVQVTTSVRNIHQPTLAAAAYAQTNITAPLNHPFLHDYGATNVTRFGDFWNIWPTDVSGENHQGYLGLKTIIKNHFTSGH